MPAIYVINKIDQITLEELNVISKLPHYSPVCAYLEWNLDGLIDMIWEYLDLIRVYTKPKVYDILSLVSHHSQALAWSLCQYSRLARHVDILALLYRGNCQTTMSRSFFRGHTQA